MIIQGDIYLMFSMEIPLFFGELPHLPDHESPSLCTVLYEYLRSIDTENQEQHSKKKSLKARFLFWLNGVWFRSYPYVLLLW